MNSQPSTLQHLVSYPAVDDDHREFVELLNQLHAADNREFAGLFRQLQQHTEQHFERENRLMSESAFPALAEHQDEHQRVLAEFKQFQSRIDKGLIGFGRAFAQERLPQWFALHITTMDSALAAHLNAARR